jgi:monovalent cation:H+ antiporter, CPA1 family
LSAFQVLATLLTIAAVFAYVNHRWVKLPAAIALMAMSLGASLVLIAIDQLGWVSLVGMAEGVLERVQLSETLLHGMLGALLFAGALHIDLQDLRREIASVVILAVVGTVLSSFLVGAMVFAITHGFGLGVGFGHCLLFGALISPTDPVAVLGMLKSARISKDVETQIAGESLLNDGVGVVIFVTVLGAVTQGGDAGIADIARLFLREAIGGAVFGLASGYVAFRLLRSIDHYQTELLITLALVVGGYSLAERIHVSAPIAAVVAGLLIGNMGRSQAMSDVTRDHLDKFWSLIDEILNAILFVLVGFEVIRIRIHAVAMIVGVLAIVGVLIARFVSVALPLAALSRWKKPPRGAIAILTWGGLRGGISVALALSLPPSPSRDLIVSTTYFVVVFSILVQGLTLGRFARRVSAPAD